MQPGSVSSESSVLKRAAYEPLTNIRKVIFLEFDRSAPQSEIWRGLHGTAMLQAQYGKIVVAVSDDWKATGEHTFKQRRRAGGGHPRFSRRMLAGTRRRCILCCRFVCQLFWRHRETPQWENMNRRETAPLASLKQESAPLRNKITQSLRRAIETGHLQPGARLVELDLCRQLNVSRTSLREALRQLQAEGILAELNNRGLAVVSISEEDAANIYSIRGVLESLIVEQFIENAPDAEVEALVRHSEQLRESYKTGMIEEIVEAIEKRDKGATRNAARTHVENSARSALSHRDSAAAERG